MIRIYKDDEIREVIKEASALYDDLYQREIKKKHSLKERIENSISLKRNTLFITEQQDERIIGVLFGFDFRKENWWAKQIDNILPKDRKWYENSFELNELYVAKGHRGKGIASRLMNRLSAIGFNHILLSVRSDNRKAIRLYSRLGYRPLRDNFYFESHETPFQIMSKDNEIS